MKPSRRAVPARRLLCSRIAGAALACAAYVAPTSFATADGVRELSTDRPDVTESPHSVPRGWLQLEMDGLVWSRHDAGPAEASTLGLAASNLKLGLSRRSDLQILFEPFVRTRLEMDGASGADEHSDTGELAVRLKWNVTGNDGGPVAIGLLPWVAWDTADRGPGIADAAGLAVPVAIGLAKRFGLGAMAEVSTSREEWSLLNTATLALDVVGPLGVFGEIAAERAFPDPGHPEWRSTFNAGATLGFGADFQLDGGVRLGLTDTVDDVTAFVGFAARRRLR